MRADDLELLSAAGRPSLSPDGNLAVVAVTRPDFEADAYLGVLWAIPTDGSGARQLTRGFRDSAPAISPDGTRVAFLRAGPAAPPQLCLVCLFGGEPITLTDHPLGAGAPSWSPDGSRLAYVARVPEPGRYGTADAEGRTPEPDAEAPRLITEPAYRQDDLGFSRDRRNHLFLLDVPTGSRPGEVPPKLPLTSRQLTDGDVDDDHPAWSPDGSLIAFVSARHDTRETDRRAGVHTVAVDGDTRPRPVVEADLAVAAVQWLPDGRLVLVAGELGPQGIDFVGRPGRLWVSEGPAGGDPVQLRVLTSPEIDVEAGDGADLGLLDGWVVVRELSRGSVRLITVDPDAVDPDAGVETLLDGPLVVTGQAMAGSRLVASISTADRAGDLALVGEGGGGVGDSEAGAGETVWLSDLSARLRTAGLRPVAELTAPTEDGHEVHGWLVLPDPDVHGEGPYPVLLNIHGGPFAQYDCAVFDESQVFAGAGYAVLQCNPRGSAGYGAEHGRSIRHAMGTVDAEDVIAFLDHGLSDPALDGDRVGVLGGSYGGYLSALLTTRTRRFAAAIVERGYLDGVSFVGSSDIGWFFPGEYHGSVAAIREQAPMSAVDQVRTPTLVIHSEHDWRCPVEQGQRWFTALRANGVPTELLLFPGEGHELSRSGRPRHRRQRFQHMLRWWQRYLPVKTGS